MSQDRNEDNARVHEADYWVIEAKNISLVEISSLVKQKFFKVHLLYSLIQTAKLLI